MYAWGSWSIPNAQYKKRSRRTFSSLESWWWRHGWWGNGNLILRFRQCLLSNTFRDFQKSKQTKPNHCNKVSQNQRVHDFAHLAVYDPLEHNTSQANQRCSKPPRTPARWCRFSLVHVFHRPLSARFAKLHVCVCVYITCAICYFRILLIPTLLSHFKILFSMNIWTFSFCYSSWTFSFCYSSWTFSFCYSPWTSHEHLASVTLLPQCWHDHQQKEKEAA